MPADTKPGTPIVLATLGRFRRGRFPHILARSCYTPDMHPTHASGPARLGLPKRAGRCRVYPPAESHPNPSARSRGLTPHGGCLRREGTSPMTVEQLECAGTSDMISSDSKGRPSRLSNKPIPPHERLIFALDFPKHSQALQMVERLGDSVHFYKLGLELFMAGNYFELVEELASHGKKVFVDLKFFDVPETVGSAVRRLTDVGATFATVHGNQSMLAAACDAKNGVKVLAVTVLTSLDRNDLHDLGFECDPLTLVLSRARRALEVGCDGVISSGLEASALRDEYGDKFLIVAPGIRPVDNRVMDDDQKRTTTVEEAFRNGADYIVVGRPIREATDPFVAAQDIQNTISRLFP